MRFAVSLNVGFSHERNDALNHSYVHYFQKIGIEPVLVPNAIRDVQAYAQSLDVQGVVLTGGNDIALEPSGSACFNGSSGSAQRNTVEAELLRMALDARIPVLGICRGMQFINVFFGGRLIHDVVSFKDGMLDHVGQPHWATFTDPGLICPLAADEFVVNSFHNHGVTQDSLAPELRAFAVSKPDNLVEGIVHPTHRILGIQWHPERPGSSSAIDTQLVEALLTRSLWH